MIGYEQNMIFSGWLSICNHNLVCQKFIPMLVINVLGSNKKHLWKFGVTSPIEAEKN